MDADQPIIEFQADGDNIELAWDVHEHFPRVVDLLQGRFWDRAYERLRDLAEAAESFAGWDIAYGRSARLRDWVACTLSRKWRVHWRCIMELNKTSRPTGSSILDIVGPRSRQHGRE